jgi:hypothetical protein
MARIDFVSIREKLVRSPGMKQAMAERAEELVDEFKDQLLDDFDNHIVTQELEEGPAAENISGTLPGLSRGGNLFSFIGFNDGDNPTASIRSALKALVESPDNAFSSSFAKGSPPSVIFTFRVKIPTLDEINAFMEDDALFPDGYSGGFWLTDLEKGNLTGLSSYIYDEEFGAYEQSRSGTGLQAKTRQGKSGKGGKLIKIRGGDKAKGIKYVEKLLQDFAKSLRGSV